MASIEPRWAQIDTDKTFDELIDELVAELYEMKAEGEDELAEVAKKLMYVGAIKGDEFQQEDVVDLVSQETDYGKMAVRDYIDRMEKKRPFWEVASVTKHEYPDRPTDFEIGVRTEFGEGSIRIAVSELEPDVFKERMAASVGVIPEFENWRVQMSEILQNPEVVNHQTENEYATAIVDALASGELTVVDDRTVFKSHPDEAAFATDEKVLIGSEAVMGVVNGVDPEMTPQGARRKLDHLMLPGSSTQLRDSDGEHFRAWRFKPSVLGGRK